MKPKLFKLKLLKHALGTFYACSADTVVVLATQIWPSSYCKHIHQTLGRTLVTQSGKRNEILETRFWCTVDVSRPKRWRERVILLIETPEAGKNKVICKESSPSTEPWEIGAESLGGAVSAKDSREIGAISRGSLRLPLVLFCSLLGRMGGGVLADYYFLFNLSFLSVNHVTFRSVV